ncbi:MAG: lamin tail domain-containing protein, partial [Crocinitomicaceae bacterium]|nr:lamin tail domain-containing protein [Crocinitomicaceae bacterium]
MKKFLPALFLAFVATSSFEQGCPANLFFSEYVEGTSFNKAVEIYNPLPYAVDLSEYNLELFTNGSPTVSSTFTMTGLLNPGETHVVCNPSASVAILGIAEETSGVINYNGDDAFILKNNLTNDTLDIIGIVGVDPGVNWAVGAGATSEFTLIRVPAVAIGTTDWSLSSLQWSVLPQNDISDLGIHTFSASTNV